jgi:glycine dehydrogenase subunit 2
VAKRLLDYDVHPPTIYFPLVIKEALMIEPPETESKQTVDHFIDVMRTVAKEAKEQPELVKGAPYTTVVKRLDEAQAARNPIVKYRDLL